MKPNTFIDFEGLLRWRKQIMTIKTRKEKIPSGWSF